MGQPNKCGRSVVADAVVFQTIIREFDSHRPLQQRIIMTKKQNKRYAKKQALKWNSDIVKEPMSAAKRRWGNGYAR